MKKQFLFAAALAALMTCACSVEPVGNQDVQPEEDGEAAVLTAGFASEGTRTVRQADGKVFWSPGDQIVVVRGKRNSKFTSTNTDPQPSAAFQGSLPSGGVNAPSSYWAVHPYDAGAVFEDNYLRTRLPDHQEAVAGTFADDLFVSVASFTSASSPLTFYHVVGGIKFSVTEPGIKTVTLIANGGEPLCGVMGIRNVNDRPAFAAWGETQSQIELTPASGTFEVGKAYYFVTLPVTLSKGFSLLFTKEDGSTAFRTTDKSVTLEAARFKTMMEVDKGISFEKDFFTYSPSTVSVPKSGGTFTVKVHASADFHFDIVSDWIWEVGHEGNPLMEATYTFKASPNGGEAREGYILLCNDSNCFFITVRQEAGSEDEWKTAGLGHHSLGMRFTATWCGYCPVMSETFRMAKAELGEKFQYACFYSSSSGGAYGFSGIDTLMDQYAISGFPTGIVDGRALIENYASEYACSLIVQAVQETEANYPTATGIGLSSSLSGETVSVDVDVYTLLADSYKLTVLLLENNIIGYQADFANGAHQDFRHDKVVRKAFTAVSGQAFSAGEAAKTSFSFSTTLEEDYDPDHLEILAYVQRPFGSQPVIQSGNYGSYYVDNCNAAPLGKVSLPDVK